MSDSSQLTVSTIVGNEVAGENGKVNFPNGIILADTPEGYYLGTTFTFPPSPFGPTPTIESRLIDLNGVQIDIQANSNIGHLNVTDKMIAGNPGVITFDGDAFGNVDNVTNIQEATTKNKVVAYTAILGDPPFLS